MGFVPRSCDLLAIGYPRDLDFITFEPLFVLRDRLGMGFLETEIYLPPSVKSRPTENLIQKSHA